MSLLITGGMGYVGSQLLSLITSDWRVTVLDNLLSGPAFDLPKHVKLVRGDIRDRELVKRLVLEHDTIIHLAGIVGAPACDIDKQFAFDVNVIGTRNIADYLHHDHRIIYISSTSAYGDKTDMRVDEETPLDPLTAYGQHKMTSEALVYNSPASFIILRPATAFGISRRARLDLLPNTLAYLALTKGELDIYQPHVIRPFIHVHDFARVLVHALDFMPWNEIYNIGNPDLTMRKGELAKMIAWFAGAEITIRDGTDPDCRNYDVSFDKLMNTGFVPECGFEEGFNDISLQLDYLMKNPEQHETPYNVKQYLQKE